MAKAKILTMLPNRADALSFYRASGPFMRMGDEFEFTDMDTFNWSTMGEFDLLFAQRPFKTQHVQVMEIAKKMGIPVIADYDDWLFDLKTDNPAWKLYSRDKEVQAALKRTIELADSIIVTTDKLSSLYKSLEAKRTCVVPNAYDSKLFPYAKETLERKKIVLWRGSTTHVHDCITVGQGFDRLIRENPDWIFVFMNQYPWFLTQDFPNVAYQDGADTIDYFRIIYDMQPAIMVHPLSNCDFNHAKSMACYIEASHAGAAFVGPNFPEFARPGATLYETENSESFYEQVNNLIKYPLNIVQNARKGWDCINSTLALNNVNQIRRSEFRRWLQCVESKPASKPGN